LPKTKRKKIEKKMGAPKQQIPAFVKEKKTVQLGGKGGPLR